MYMLVRTWTEYVLRMYRRGEYENVFVVFALPPDSYGLA
jgi:hypothetical protein